MAEALGRTGSYATIGATMALIAETIRHLQPDLKSSLAAVDIDEVVGERLLFDYHQSLARLAERPKVR